MTNTLGVVVVFGAAVALGWLAGKFLTNSVCLFY